MVSSSEAVTRAQLSALDDTDCYASVWEQILSKQRRTGQSTHIWGGKGKGGRGLGRRTIQPNDVVVEDVRLQYLLRDACLLENATIKLLHNHIYCLLGRNGSGKSTLLKKMHSQMIPGWSVQWSTLYVPPKLPSEYSQLTPIQVLTKYLDECKRNSRLATESLISELENRMDCLDLENEEDEMEYLCEELSMLEDNLDFEDSSIQEQIPEFFRELGFFDHEKPCEELSPGQQKEVLLCAASVCCPFTNLILLDEPTNDLDVHGLIRLRQLINDNLARSTTVVMVSHDVDLINDVATDIIDMHAKKLWYYPGNYDSYRLMKDQKETHQLNESLSMEKKADQLKKSLQNLKEKPTPKRKGGANKKAKSVANHRKKIERHEKSMNTVADSSSIISTEGKHLTAAQQLKLANITKCIPDKAVQFILPMVTSQWGEPLIIAYDVGYGTEEDVAKIEARAQDPMPELDYTELSIVKRDGFLFDCVDLCIEEGSRTCIVGPSISTSCLMNVLAKRLAPIEGTVHHPSGVSIGYCDSRAINEMISNTGQTTSALEYLSRLYPKKMDKDLRGHLTAFGLSPISQAKTPLVCLSGGETFRLALAKIILDEPPILFLEHPTSHLDVESVQALAYGLQQWNGTVVMICQDASFLRSMKGIKCVVVIPEEGKIRRIVDDDRGTRGIDAYLKTLQSKINNI